MAESQLPRRVLLTGDTVGGVWTFALELSRGLIQEGLDVCLVTFGQGATEAQKREASSINGLLWHDAPFRLEWMEDPWDDIHKSGCWLLSLASDFKADLVHLNTLCHGALPWDLPVTLTVHSCVASWWSAVKRAPLPDSWSRYLHEVTRSLAAADLITAPSSAALATVGQHYNLDLSNARVVPNAISASRYYAGPKENFILAVGRLWDEGKNIGALADVAPNLTWPVYLAGASRSPEGEQKTLPACRLLGHLSSAQLASWYARAAIYALPARYEPFGLSVLEAALSGCALVLGDLPSLREIWGEAAIFVHPEDSQVLQAAITSLAADTARRARLAELAGLRAQEFTQPRMTHGYLDAYRSAMMSRLQRRETCVS